MPRGKRTRSTGGPPVVADHWREDYRSKLHSVMQRLLGRCSMKGDIVFDIHVETDEAILSCDTLQPPRRVSLSIEEHIASLAGPGCEDGFEASTPQDRQKLLDQLTEEALLATLPPDERRVRTGNIIAERGLSGRRTVRKSIERRLCRLLLEDLVNDGVLTENPNATYCANAFELGPNCLLPEPAPLTHGLLPKVRGGVVRPGALAALPALMPPAGNMRSAAAHWQSDHRSKLHTVMQRLLGRCAMKGDIVFDVRVEMDEAILSCDTLQPPRRVSLSIEEHIASLTGAGYEDGIEASTPQDRQNLLEQLKQDCGLLPKTSADEKRARGGVIVAEPGLSGRRTARKSIERRLCQLLLEELVDDGTLTENLNATSSANSFELGPSFVKPEPSTQSLQLLAQMRAGAGAAGAPRMLGGALGGHGLAKPVFNEALRSKLAALQWAPPPGQPTSVRWRLPGQLAPPHPLAGGSMQWVSPVAAPLGLNRPLMSTTMSLVQQAAQAAQRRAGGRGARGGTRGGRGTRGGTRGGVGRLRGGAAGAGAQVGAREEEGQQQQKTPTVSVQGLEQWCEQRDAAFEEEASMMADASWAVAIKMPASHTIDGAEVTATGLAGTKDAAREAAARSVLEQLRSKSPLFGLVPLPAAKRFKFGAFPRLH